MSEEQVQAVAVEADTSVDTEQVAKVEKEARQFGWVPKEEFRGSEDAWVDAEAFVKRGKEINPILRKNNERLMQELETTRKQMSELKEATEEFKKFQREAYDRKAQELQFEISKLREQKKDAIRAGDGDLAVDLEEQIDDLKELQAEEKRKAKEPAKAEPQQEQPKLTPEVEEWLGDNSWYTKDSKMRAATDALAVQINKEQPWLTGKAFFEQLDAELAEVFTSEKLGKRVRPNSPVSSSTTTTTSRPNGSKKSYDHLPSDAKAACDKFVRQGLMTKEEYIASYDW